MTSFLQPEKVLVELTNKQTMKKNHFFIFLFFSVVSNTGMSQTNVSYTFQERASIKLFRDFIVHVSDCIEKKIDIAEDPELKYILFHYLFVNRKLDTLNETNLGANEIKADQVGSLKKELHSFYNFLQEHMGQNLADNLTAIPLRLADNKFVYQRLSAFQRDNTLIFYDKRFPDHQLGYMLFMPPLKEKISDTKIWSWTLMFKFGKFVFKSVTGEEGQEYIFSPEMFKHNGK